MADPLSLTSRLASLTSLAPASRQVVSFRFEMPPCDEFESDDEDGSCPYYAHGCHDPLEPFANWPGRRGDRRVAITAASVLDSAAFAHACGPLPGGGSRMCPGVSYEDPPPPR